MAENKHRKTGVWKMLLTSSLLFVLCSGWAFPAGAEPEKGFQIVRHYLSDYVYDEQAGTGRSYGQGSWQEILPQDAAGKYPLLTEALRTFCDQEKTEQEQTFAEYTETAREILQDEGFEYEAHLETRMLPRRFDQDTFSFLKYCETYTGGVHGYYYYNGYNYDPATGEQISLQQVCPDIDLLKNAITEELKTKYEGWYFLEAGVDLSLYETGEDPYHFNWVLDHDGLLVFFNPYEIASYAEGIQTVFLTWDRYPELFDSRYFPEDAAYAYQLMPYPNEEVDLDGDGTPEQISFYTDADEYGLFGSVTVNVGDTTFSENIYGHQLVPVLMHTQEGNNFLFLEYTTDNDYHTSLILELTAGSIRKTAEPGEGFGGIWKEEWEGTASTVPADPKQFTMATRIHMLSSYIGVRDYTLTEDGTVQPLEDFFEVPGGQTLKTVRDLPALLLPDGEEGSSETSGEPIIIPAGTSLQICGSDDQSHVNMRREDGSIVRLTVEKTGNGWPMMINGEDAENCFEQTYYAG